MRRIPLRPVPPPDRRSEPGYHTWHASVFGNCALCGEGTQRLERHHVISEQHVRAIDPSQAWDMRNSLLLGAHCRQRCHSRHTTAAQRIPASAVPPAAIEFAIALMGCGPAELYFDRYYAP